MNRLHITAAALFFFQSLAIAADFRDDVVFSIWCALLAAIILAEGCAVLTQGRR